MKSNRHTTILRLVAENNIETQEELGELLRKSGFDVTQATISRDIRQLNLTKVSTGSGKQKYAVVPANVQNVSDKLIRVFKETVISMDCAGNLLVIKTLTGMAMAVAVTIDDMNNNEVLGTIAGDDVVFCAVRSPEGAVELIDKLRSIIKE